MGRKRSKHGGVLEGGALHPRARSYRAASAATPPDDAVEALITRARKSWVRGESRRALVLLREACAIYEWRPRTWTICGARLVLSGRREEAAQAFKQARWLRLRAGERGRVGTMDRLLADLLPAAA